MTWMTIAWPMVIGACVTMGMIQLRVGFRRTPGATHLLFALNAFVVAVYAGFELAMTRADNPASYLAALRWMDIIGGGVLVASLAAFVWAFFGTGRKWLALLAPGLLCIALIPDLLPEPKLVFLHITGVKTMRTFGGGTYPLAEGVRNSWNFVFYLGVLLLLVFVVDASVTLWRRGARHRAAVVGGSITFFILFAGVHSALVDAGIVRTPYFFSFAYLAILVAMGLELSNDVLNAAQLASELRESETRMTLAAEAANLGIWIRDLVRNEIWATDNWRALLGFTRSERIDLDGYFQKLHPEDREAVRQTFTNALAGDGLYETEYRVVLPDGGIRWIGSRGRVEFNGGGKPVRVRGVSADISARKRAEQEIAHQRRQVTHLSRVNMLGELAGSLAHELNQPLTAILSNAQAAQRFLARDKVDLNEVRDILGDIVGEDKRAGEVIRRLRLLLKTGEVQNQPLNVNEVVLEVLKLVRSELVNQNFTAQTELAPRLPLINGDRVHLQQVLLNLVMNGCDAMASVARSNRQLTISTGLGGDNSVHVSVADCGAGVEPERLEQVFEPFYTTKPHGIGLGLTVCRTIITAHGGKLWATCNRGRGATFHFSLPLVKQEPA